MQGTWSVRLELHCCSCWQRTVHDAALLLLPLLLLLLLLLLPP
jgi:hypothetical protein